MGDRENPPVAREIEEGRLVAQYLNERQGTDYEAQAGDHEPADVVLVSRGGQHRRREAQVVTIPLDFRHRDDNQDVQR
jgi:sirohydrochlorin ferrochelatase